MLISNNRVFEGQFLRAGREEGITIEKKLRTLQKSWRTAAPGCMQQAGAPAPHDIDVFNVLLVREGIFAEVSNCR